MKKTVSIIALFLLLTVGPSLTGCAKTDGNTLPGPSAPASPTQTSSETQQPETGEATETPGDTGAGSTVVTEQYVSGGIVIHYPQLVSLSDREALDRANRLLEDGALRDLDFITNSEGDVTYELDYAVTYFTSEFISVRFDGYSYVEGAAHPSSPLFSVNIDLQSRTAIGLADLVQINESFVDVFKNGTVISDFFTITPDISEAIELEINAVDDDEWVNRFAASDKDITENYGNIFSYLTDTDLLISVPVPQVLGGHAEIMIPYSELSELKTPAEVWDAFPS